MISLPDPLRSLSRRWAHGAGAGVCLLCLAVCVPNAPAQTDDGALLDGDGSARKYILELAGTVLNETFSGITMALQFSGPPPGSANPYQMIAGGFPDAQTRNAFFWNTGDSTMAVTSNRITCKIRPGFPAAPDIFFFYLSPALLERPLTHRDKEDRQRSLKTVMPTKVFAQAGELSLTISSGSVSGSVWMQGYDTIEKSYVRYSARFTGRRAMHVEQKLQ